jgi:hypothetical protein
MPQAQVIVATGPVPDEDVEQLIRQVYDPPSAIAQRAAEMLK